MSIFTPGWVPWNGWGHLLFWVLLAALVELATHNITRWYRARTGPAPARTNVPSAA